MIVITLVLCCGSRASAAPAFPLHTSGASIVDANGNRVRLSAFNWAGAESADFVVAGLQVATLQSIVDQVKSLGFNAVRIPWSNQLVESNPVVQNYALAANPGMQGQNALTIFDQVVNALTGAGIMVILDNHNSNAEWCCSTTDGNTLWYNSQYPQSNWVADWQNIVQRYKSNPWVIGADLRNELRGTASWGGNSSTDWHAAAQLGGNAVLGVNPNLLIFVEGVNYSGDLSGVTNLPVQLSVPNKLVYEAHDYGFWYTGLASYNDWLNRITPKWGYLASGNNPQPLWVGEFGTCNTSDNCVNSSNNSNLGYWFQLITSYMQDYGVNWSYWSINGTQSTGNGRTYGAVEGYGVLNASWNGGALGSLTLRLQSMMNTTASPSVSLIPAGSAITVAHGGAGASTVTIVPQNGFAGTVNLACAVTSPFGAIDPPTCTVPSSQSLSGTSAVSATVLFATTRSASNSVPGAGPSKIFPRKFGGAVLACALLLIGNLARRRKALLTLLIATLAVFPLAACSGGGGGGGNTSSTSTSAGTYTVTVTATAPGLTLVGAQVSFNVQ